MDLLLVRHAQTHANVARALDTASPGEDLTDLGVEQADALGRLLVDETFDGVWCSDRVRARRTAEAVGRPHGLVPTVDPRLAEISAGEKEMSTVREDALAYRDGVVAWMEGDLERRLLGGETGTEALARMDAGIGAVLASGASRAVVVSHGSMIRFWCAVRVPQIGSDLTHQPLGNTGFARLRHHGDSVDGRWSCSEWDSVAIEPGGEAGPASDAL